MIRLLIFILFFILSLDTESQIELLKEIKTNAKRVTADNIGNYYLYNNSKVDKYDKTGEKLFTYSNNQLGELERIDVTNPLRNLVLHKSQNTITILDNMLSSKQNEALDLTLANLYNTTAFTYSTIDNGIWFYDQELFQLIKIDLKLNRIYESGNLLRLLNLDSLTITDIYEQNDKLYLTTKTSILVFDLYGAYYSTIHNNDATVIGIEESIIYSFTPKYFKAYNTKTFEEQKLNANFSRNAEICYKKNKLYVIDDGKFSIYKINKP